MSNRWIGLGLVLGALVLGPSAGRVAAQHINAYEVPEIGEIHAPIPLGHDRMNTGGFYWALEGMYMIQNRAIGHQNIAVRGIVDASGGLTGDPILLSRNLIQTGVPGTFLGSGAPALSTGDFQGISYQCGLRSTLGYKFDSGIALSVSWLHLWETKLTATASGVNVGYQNDANLSDSFLFSPVYNFPADFAGPRLKVSADITIMQFFDSLIVAPPETPRPVTDLPRFNEPLGFTSFGIWNGANNMAISFTTRYDQWDLTARIPVWETEYARTYALAGGRHAWFFDRFWWRTQAIGFSTNPGPANNDDNGDDPPNDPADLMFFTVSHPVDVATYSNTLSQRMYGPTLGCGYEVYLCEGVSLSTDWTGGLLFNIIKERAKYKLGDETVQNKRSRNLFNLTPNFQGDMNLWWYPLRGISFKLGYNFMGYFNAKRMLNPVGFNYGAIEYVNDDRFRFLHGVNFGVGFTF